MNRLTRHYFIATILVLRVVFGATLLHAADGQLEINQACAVNTGCFPGDAPGFPVTITTPGSYRLTGNLDLSAVASSLDGIEVSASAVTVDLGGFHIAGSTTCSGSGASISCSPSGGGSGVRFVKDLTAAVVQNGIVRNMAGWGILSSARATRVQDITALHNGVTGIVVSKGSLVTSSVAIENGGNGFASGTGGSVFDGVTAMGNGNAGVGMGGGMVTRANARENGGRGFELTGSSKFGKDNVSLLNTLDDRCEGGICTERRRLYITKELHTGFTFGANGVCAAGFHVASLADYIAIDQFDYDYVLGVGANNTFGSMSLRAEVWVKSAQWGTPEEDASCLLGGAFGTTVSGWIPGPDDPANPRRVSHQLYSSWKPCGESHLVACVDIPYYGTGP